MATGTLLIKQLFQELEQQNLSISPQLKQDFERWMSMGDVPRSWAEGSNIRADRVSAKEGDFDKILKKAQLGHTGLNSQTLSHNTWTTLSGYNFEESDGLKTNASEGWIELGGVQGKNYMLINARVAFDLASSTGDRLVRYQLYNRKTDTWGTSFEIGICRASANNWTIPSSSYIVKFTTGFQDLTRIRIQVKQDSGSNLNVHGVGFTVVFFP